MEAVSTDIRVVLRWELLCTDDLVVIAETEDDLIKRLNEWKDNVENRGMRVNMSKTFLFYLSGAPAHLGSPGQSPGGHKTVVLV